MFTYPQLRMAVLNGLVSLKDHLDALDAADSPYDAETTAVLKKLLAPQVVEKEVVREVQVEAKSARGRPSRDVRLSEEDQKMVIDDLKTLISNLRDMEVGKELETKDQIQVTKTKASLTEQLLKMQERMFNVVNMARFQETVMGILNDLVDESGRETFMKRLEPYR